MTDSWFIETPVGIEARVTPKGKDESQRDKEESFPLQVVGFDVICDIIVWVIKWESFEDWSFNRVILQHKESQIRHQGGQKVPYHPLFCWIKRIFDGLIKIQWKAEAQSHVGHIKDLVQKLLCNVENSKAVVVQSVNIFPWVNEIDIVHFKHGEDGSCH